MSEVRPSRCWAEISREALHHNAAVARERVGSGVNLLAVVKANAYGHGAVEVARTLHDEAQLFGVANLDEAIELRKSDVTLPVIILGPAVPDERPEIVARGFIASVSSVEEAAAFSRAPRERAARINFVIDTGMGRMGTWHSEAAAALEQIAALPNIEIHSVSTHLPVADEDAVFTRAELSTFAQLVRELRSRVDGDYAVHVLLSAGILAFPHQPYDVVRAGLILYGISPLPEFQSLLRPAMTLKSRVVLLRDVPAGRDISYGRTFTTPHAMRIAAIGAGYADGYPRALSNTGASVLIGGVRCPVLGRVTMDLTLVDVTDIESVNAGDEVVLIGRQGESEILASEVASRARTIAWEIFTGIGSRVRRVYV
jgi:alanine racemase